MFKKYESLENSYNTKTMIDFANAVFSKDSWTNKDFGKFIKNFLNDVYEDVQKDGIELPQDEKISNLLRCRVQKEIVAQFKNYFFGRI